MPNLRIAFALAAATAGSCAPTGTRNAAASSSSTGRSGTRIAPDPCSTICWRNSAAYGGLDFGIADTSSSQQDQVSTKSGQLQSPAWWGDGGNGVAVLS